MKILKKMLSRALVIVVAAGAILLSGCDGSNLQDMVDSAMHSSPSNTSNAAPGPADATLGKSWTVRSTSATVSLRAVAWSGSLYVAVGTESTILTSPDGVSWTPRTIAGGYYFQDIVWSGTQFVAVGLISSGGQDDGSAQAAVFTSPDGMTWTSRKLFDRVLLNGICWTGTQFVAVGVQSNGLDSWAAIFTSPDGITWTTQTIGLASGSGLQAVVWSGTQFVAVGSSEFGHVFTSPDGVTWTPRHSGSNETLTSVVWSGAQFVAVGGGVSTSSPDGITWTAHPTTTPLGGSICWNGKEFAAIGNGIFSSPDGMQWTKRSDAVDLVRIAWTGDKFVAVGGGGIIVTSSDGVTWIARTPLERLTSIAWSGSRFVAVGDLGRAMTSPDGITWTVHSTGSNNWLKSIVSSDTQLVAVGWQDFGGAIETTPDGITWTSYTPGPHALNAVAWSGKQYVAVGDYGTVLTSADGAQWSSQPTGTTDHLTGVAWTGTQFSAVGWRCIKWKMFAPNTRLSSPVKSDGPEFCSQALDIALTSPDGKSWTTHVLESDYIFHKIIWTGTQFIALSSHALLTSPDGNVWTLRHDNSSLKDVIWTGMQAVAVGSGGEILTSNDGDAWTAAASDTTMDIAMIAWSGTRFVAVGPNVILTSP